VGAGGALGQLAAPVASMLRQALLGGCGDDEFDALRAVKVFEVFAVKPFKFGGAVAQRAVLSLGHGQFFYRWWFQ
jgi:hypothetical protein